MEIVWIVLELSFNRYSAHIVEGKERIVLSVKKEKKDIGKGKELHRQIAKRVRNQCFFFIFIKFSIIIFHLLFWMWKKKNYTIRKKIEKNKRVRRKGWEKYGRWRVRWHNTPSLIYIILHYFAIYINIFRFIPFVWSERNWTALISSGFSACMQTAAASQRDQLLSTTLLILSVDLRNDSGTRKWTRTFKFASDARLNGKFVFSEL